MRSISYWLWRRWHDNRRGLLVLRSVVFVLIFLTAKIEYLLPFPTLFTFSFLTLITRLRRFRGCSGGWSRRCWCSLGNCIRVRLMGSLLNYNEEWIPSSKSVEENIIVLYTHSVKIEGFYFAQGHRSCGFVSILELVHLNHFRKRTGNLQSRSRYGFARWLFPLCWVSTRWRNNTLWKNVWLESINWKYVGCNSGYLMHCN